MQGPLAGDQAPLPADGRARYNNYGKGVLLWETDAEAACFVNVQQLVSSDLYWFTDPNELDMTGQSWLPEGERQMTLAEVREVRITAIRSTGCRRSMPGTVGESRSGLSSKWAGRSRSPAAQGGRAILPEEIQDAVWH